MREMKRMEARVFKWFGYVSLRPIYYILYMIFWMITMYCEVSYLYIELLTQLSYLTYVGFLNITYLEFLLTRDFSMANVGLDTNRLQFFITTVKTSQYLSFVGASITYL